MNVLAIDTSASLGVVGIATSEHPTCEVMFPAAQGHAFALIPTVEWLLASCQHKLADMDAFGVTIGPGSFTGLRIGLATIKGFAWTLKKPVVSLCSLEVLAYGLGQCLDVVAVMIEAGRGRVYGALFDCRNNWPKRLTQPADIAPDKLLSNVTDNCVCVGSGALRYKDVLKNVASGRLRFALPEFAHTRGSSLSLMARAKLLRGEVADIETLVPTYIRKSAAEDNWLKKEKEAS